MWRGHQNSGSQNLRVQNNLLRIFIVCAFSAQKTVLLYVLKMKFTGNDNVVMIFITLYQF